MDNSEVNYREIISETMSRHYNVADEFKENTVEENREICRRDSLGFGVAVLNITGDLNIGIMIRTASLLGAEKFFIFGRRQYDKRSTVGAHKYIDVERIGEISTRSIGEVCFKQPYVPVFIEQGGIGIQFMRSDLRWIVDSPHHINPLFIFGSESDGIPEEIIKEISQSPGLQSYHYSIPQRGVLRSLNVSSAMSIVSWEWNRIFIDRGI